MVINNSNNQTKKASPENNSTKLKKLAMKYRSFMDNKYHFSSFCVLMTEIPLLFRGVSAASAFALGITLKVHSSATVRSVRR